MWVYLVLGFLAGVVVLQVGVIRLVQTQRIARARDQSDYYEALQTLRDHQAAEATRLSDESRRTQEASWKTAMAHVAQERNQADLRTKQAIETLTSAIDRAVRSVAYPRPPYIPAPELLDQTELSRDGRADGERIPSWMNWDEEESDTTTPMEVE